MLVLGYGTSSNLYHTALSKQTNLLYELKAILSICMIIAKKVYLKRCDNSIFLRQRATAYRQNNNNNANA